MSKPPPPRYKIVERRGRLFTIDTWAQNDESQQSSLGTPRMARGRGAAERVVAALLPVSDEQGRRLLTTSPKWDRKGPRVIALSPGGEKRIGTLLIGSAIAIVVILSLTIVKLDLLMPFLLVGVVLFGSASTAGAPAFTRFLDSLGEEQPR